LGRIGIVMTFNEYQEQAKSTAIFPECKFAGLPSDFAYPLIGLCGEVGELAEKYKKLIRDGYFDKDLVIKEMGDVLWYLSALATTTGIEFEEVAAKNLEKLKDRKDRGVIQGSGDNR
jgi:NTP pyrophosphatase (non-canonical NTP hydrolase)